MGCGGSKSTPVERERWKKSKGIDKQLRTAWMESNDTLHLLLLGSSGSGKRTIFEKLKHVHGVRLSEEQRKQEAQHVHRFLIHSMKVLISQGSDFGVVTPIETTREYVMIKSMNEQISIPGGAQDQLIAVLEALRVLWENPCIQEVWERRSEFQISDSVSYLFDRIDEFKAPGYIPDDAVLSHAQATITGVTSDIYRIRGAHFAVTGVSGQLRTTRRKWIHCFEEAAAIIFVASLTEYDEVIEGEGRSRRRNKLVDTLQLFAEICNNICFLETPIILVLNKSDVFRELIVQKPFQACGHHFADYQGQEGDYDDGVKYIVDRFKALDYAPQATTGKRTIYTAVLSAHENNTIASVLYQSCKDILLRANAEDRSFSLGPVVSIQ